MATLEKVVIKIEVDTKDLKPTVKKLEKLGLVSKKNAKQFKKTSQEFEKSAKKTQKSASSIESSISKIGIALVGAFTVQAVIQFGKELFTTAVQMEAFAKRAKTVFGESINIVEEFAKRNAIALGLTKSEFIGAAAAIGDVIVPLGLSRKRAAEMSVTLTKLGGALKQFTGDQREASEIASIAARALTGETEGLKALGVVVSQNTKEFRELVKTKIRDEGVTEIQAKALAIYDTILQRSGDALGAFEDNTTSLVRQQEEIGAQWRGLTEQLAGDLTPAFLGLTTGLNEALKAWSALQSIGVSFSNLLNPLKLRADLYAKAEENLADAIKESADNTKKVIEQEKKRTITIGNLKEDITKLKKEQNQLSLSASQLAKNLLKIRDIEEQLKKLYDEANEAIAKQGFEYKKLKPIIEEIVKIKEKDVSIEEFLAKAESERQSEAIKAAEERKTRNDTIISEAIALEEQLFNIISNINEGRLVQIENDRKAAINAIEEKAKAGILAEDEVADARLAITEKFDAERAKILTKQAKADQIAAIIAATINTAVAVTATLEIPILAALIAVAGAVEIATIAAQPIPVFHKGKRGEYSDEEINAKVLRSEYVIPPKQSRKHSAELDAMLSDKFERFVFMKYQMPIIKKYSNIEQAGFSDTDITRHQRKHTKLLAENNQLLRNLIPSMKRASTW